MKTIRYSRLFNLGNYENEKIELEEEFASGVSDEIAISTLKKRVEAMHQRSTQLDEEIEDEQQRQSRLNYLQREKERLEREMKNLETPTEGVG